MRTILSTMLVLALLAACTPRPQSSAGGDAGTPPSAQPAPPTQGGAQQLTVQITPGTASSAGGGEQRASAQAAAGGAVVQGVMSTPTPCQRLAGTAERSGGTVTVRVSATADPEMMCVQSIGSIPYTATVRGLPAGAYTLRVQHTYPGTGWETATVLETSVTVR